MLGLAAGSAALQRRIIQSMMTTMAINCSKTRNRINFCDVHGEPPRIVLISPSSSTSATAATAIGMAT
jgi:hypothetical protein